MDSLVIKILGGLFNGLTYSQYIIIALAIFLTPLIISVILTFLMSYFKVNGTTYVISVTICVTLAGFFGVFFIKYNPRAEIVNTKTEIRVVVDKLSTAERIKDAYEEKYEKQNEKKYEKQDEEIDVDKYIEELNK